MSSWITLIDKDNIELVKIFLNAGIQIRHLKNLTFMNFAVDDTYFYATIDKMENGNVMNNLLTSNEPAYIRHYSLIFEDLWTEFLVDVDLTSACVHVIAATAGTFDIGMVRRVGFRCGRFG